MDILSGIDTYPGMEHLPGNFNLATLTWPNEIAFTCTNHEIPGHTAHSVDHMWNSLVYSTVDHMWNSWAYSNHAAITCTLYFVLRECPDMVLTFVHVLTYLPNPHALSKKAMAGNDVVSKLEYSPVKKIRESEALLVRQCSSCLGDYGLTLWVVSILMYAQELHNCFLCLLCCMPAMWSKYKYNLPANICTSVHPRISNIFINNTNCTSVLPRISNILINNTNCMPMISSANTGTTMMMYCSTFLQTA